MLDISGYTTPSPVTTVALVDDDPEIREACRILLEGAGYAVVEATNGADAVAVLRVVAQRVVVLLDEHMPGLTGSDVVAAARDDRDLQRHQYILFTADTSAVVRHRQATLAPYGVRVLAKPFDLDDLLEAIAKAAAQLW